MDDLINASNTTVQDELALCIGACINAGMSPNDIAGVLLRSGWRPPEGLAYLDGMELTRG
ncbi:hypothetical protein [Amycolatopsis taiwanensis]|uniref:hypothetical protein n=1 Tax=Amycolatopsis taiwanensis TaxID=342230 RepID=UPI00048975A4|nr:hypothetical protein [Amycolatopsis taiwanensis]